MRHGSTSGSRFPTCLPLLADLSFDDPLLCSRPDPCPATTDLATHASMGVFPMDRSADSFRSSACHTASRATHFGPALTDFPARSDDIG
jgi:hypothetical protein